MFQSSIERYAQQQNVKWFGVELSRFWKTLSSLKIPRDSRWDKVFSTSPAPILETASTRNCPSPLASLVGVLALGLPFLLPACLTRGGPTPFLRLLRLLLTPDRLEHASLKMSDNVSSTDGLPDLENRSLSHRSEERSGAEAGREVCSDAEMSLTRNGDGTGDGGTPSHAR